MAIERAGLGPTVYYRKTPGGISLTWQSIHKKKPPEDNEVKPTATTHSGKVQSSASAAQEGQPHWPIRVGDVPSPRRPSWAPHRSRSPRGCHGRAREESTRAANPHLPDVVTEEKKNVGSHVDKSKCSHCRNGKSPRRKDSGDAKGGPPHLGLISRAPCLPASP